MPNVVAPSFGLFINLVSSMAELLVLNLSTSKAVYPPENVPEGIVAKNVEDVVVTDRTGTCGSVLAVEKLDQPPNVPADVSPR